MLKRILVAGIFVFSGGFTGNPLSAVQNGQFREAPIESDFQLAVAFSPQGKSAASAGSGGLTRLWDPRTGKPILVIPGPDSRTRRALAFSPDGKALAVGGDGGSVCLYEVQSGKQLRVFGDHVGFVKALAFSPNGKDLVTSAVRFDKGVAEEAEIRLWDIATGNVKHAWKLAHHEYSSSLAISPDGCLLASAEGALRPIGPVRIRDLRTGEVTKTFDLGRGYVYLVAFSPDGKELAGGGPVDRDVSVLHIWNLHSGTVRLNLEKIGPNVQALTFSPDGQVLATSCDGLLRQGSPAAEVRLWNVKNGDLLRTSEEGQKSIPSLAFAPDGRTFILCDENGVILVDASTGRLKSRFTTVTRRQAK